jgi:DNA-binding CsgD family transcriptional regulator
MKAMAVRTFAQRCRIIFTARQQQAFKVVDRGVVHRQRDGKRGPGVVAVHALDLLARCLGRRQCHNRAPLFQERTRVGVFDSLDAIRHRDGNPFFDFLFKPLDAERLCAIVGAALVASLTPREREVMALIVEGKLNKQVAALLGTVEKTVKSQRASVMRKTGASSFAALVRLWDAARPS